MNYDTKNALLIMIQMRRYYFYSLGISLVVVAFCVGKALSDAQYTMILQKTSKALIGMICIQMVIAIQYLHCYGILAKRLHQRLFSDIGKPVEAASKNNNKTKKT